VWGGGAMQGKDYFMRTFFESVAPGLAGPGPVWLGEAGLCVAVQGRDIHTHQATLCVARPGRASYGEAWKGRVCEM